MGTREGLGPEKLEFLIGTAQRIQNMGPWVKMHNIDLGPKWTQIWFKRLGQNSPDLGFRVLRRLKGFDDHTPLILAMARSAEPLRPFGPHM